MFFCYFQSLWKVACRGQQSSHPTPSPAKGSKQRAHFPVKALTSRSRWAATAAAWHRLVSALLPPSVALTGPEGGLGGGLGQSSAGRAPPAVGPVTHSLHRTDRTLQLQCRRTHGNSDGRTDDHAAWSAALSCLSLPSPSDGGSD